MVPAVSPVPSAGLSPLQVPNTYLSTDRMHVFHHPLNYQTEVRSLDQDPMMDVPICLDPWSPRPGSQLPSPSILEGNTWMWDSHVLGSRTRPHSTLILPSPSSAHVPELRCLTRNPTWGQSTDPGSTRFKFKSSPPSFSPGSLGKAASLD